MNPFCISHVTLKECQNHAMVKINITDLTRIYLMVYIWV